MIAFAIRRTGRHYAAQKYNRTTGRWLDGGEETILRAFKSTEARDEYVNSEPGFHPVDLADLDDGDVVSLVAEPAQATVTGYDGEAFHEDAADDDDVSDAALDELDRRRKEAREAIEAWDGEDIGALRRMLNDADELCEPQHRPEPLYDTPDLEWAAPFELNNEAVYASDRKGGLLVLVAGTTDDGWTTTEASDWFEASTVGRWGDTDPVELAKARAAMEALGQDWPWLKEEEAKLATEESA